MKKVTSTEDSSYYEWDEISATVTYHYRKKIVEKTVNKTTVSYEWHSNEISLDKIPLDINKKLEAAPEKSRASEAEKEGERIKK